MALGFFKKGKNIVVVFSIKTWVGYYRYDRHHHHLHCNIPVHWRPKSKSVSSFIFQNKIRDRSNRLYSKL